MNFNLLKPANLLLIAVVALAVHALAMPLFNLLDGTTGSSSTDTSS